MNKTSMGKNRLNKASTVFALAFLLPAIASVAVYVWQQGTLNDQQEQAREVERALNVQINTLQDRLDRLETRNLSEEKETETKFDNKLAKSIMENRSWSKLEKYAEERVEIIVVRSTGLSVRTSRQIAGDMNDLDGASGPWNFELDQAVIDGYRAGSYGSFLKSDIQLIGRSSNGIVVAFSLSIQGKITDIFISEESFFKA